ncbi:MAG: NAD(P)H-dependent oxidoreductase [Acidimicrobiales bacterium]
MTTVVVQAHPLEESYSAALRSRLVDALASAGVEVATFRLGQGEEPDAETLAAARRLVLVYPTWSGGLPALLLGWVHRLLGGPPVLDRVEELVVVTTCGSSKLINLVQGEWGRRYLKTVVLGRCAPGARFRWVPLYKIDRRTPAETAAHLDRVADAVGATSGPGRLRWTRSRLRSP